MLPSEPLQSPWTCMPSLEILVRNPGCLCWSRRRGEARTGQASSLSLAKALKSRNQSRLSGSTPAAHPCSWAVFPCKQCCCSTQAWGGGELGVAMIEAWCTLRDLARKRSGPCMSSPLPGREGIHGVMGLSCAEVAAQCSSSSGQPVQAGKERDE